MTANGPNPNPLPDVDPGDKITWTNNLSVSVNLTYPTCVSPGGSATILAGASGQQQNVNNGANGNYTYSYAWTSGDTQSGTIDVS
jgi:plastocyanin